MKISRLPLFSAAAFSIFAMSASAADTTALPNLSQALASQAAAKTDSSEGAAQTSATAQNKVSNTAQTTGETSATGTSTGPSPTAVITGGGIAAGSESVPTITGGQSATNGGNLPPGLPTLSGAFVVVAPSVPPTADAPFMRVSNLPEGTVFIVVGAVLGFMAMSVLLWRALVAWSLHRSIKRAALAQSASHEKPLFRPKPGGAAPFYQYNDRESTISLGPMAGGKRKSMRPTTASGPTSAQTLFFSPTAGATLHNAGNRGSNYLPAGYYAAGTAQPGDGQGRAHIGNGAHGNSISFSNLGPARDGYARARSIGPSPPGSPAFPVTNPGYMASSSTLNLNHQPGHGRAPSVFLDELFDSEGGPPVPGHHANGSQHRF